jgi:hypothetical protein
MKHRNSIVSLITGLLFTTFVAGQTISNQTVITKPTTLSGLQNLKLIRPVTANVFSSSFNLQATGRNDMNAYLLCYLSTLVYPDYMALKLNNSTPTFVEQMHRDPDFFKTQYIREIAPLFNAPVFEFIRSSDRLGYDPEAMVISTASANYVVFRGTDRVGSNKPGLLYDVAEWISTDFDAVHHSTPALTGKVLRGMWLSLEYEKFNERLFNYIQSKGGSSKKLWITGHSLGAGQAQLFAMFAAKKGLTAQGVYGFAAPNPGNQDFVTEMDRLFPNNRLQRFEFSDDPITMLSSPFLFWPAGTRVYYRDINTMEFNKTERSPAEWAAIIPGVTGAAANIVTDKVNELSGGRLKLDNLLGRSPMCYHHPTWYLQAAFKQLTPEERKKVPAPLPIPDASEAGCDANTSKLGRNANPDFFVWAAEKVKGEVDNAVAAVQGTVEQLTFNATNIINNVTGQAIQEGDYYIISHPSKERLGLNEQEGFDNASSLSLTKGRSKVRIRRAGTIGYVIEFGSRVVSGFFGNETKTYVLDSEGASLYQSGSSEIQLWEKNNFPLANMNQRWLFIQVSGNRYIIKNLENGKVLDANNDNINSTSCRVKTYRPINNDQTQIWVLEKVN